MTLKDRFWSKVDKSSDCWEWTGYKSRYGYIRDGKVRLAHRVSWELENGTIPEGMCVLHKCDNPPCVNPAHLFLGTVADNCKDRDDKGRQVTPKGSNHGNSIFNEKTIKYIRDWWVTGDIKQTDLAEIYGIKQGHISDIVLRKIWTHI